MNNKELVDRWVRQKVGPRGLKTKSIFCNKQTIYSYGHHFPMAQHIVIAWSDGSPRNIIVVNPRRYSKSTSRHQSLLPYYSSYKVVPEMWDSINDEASLKHAVDATDAMMREAAAKNARQRRENKKRKVEEQYDRACKDISDDPTIPNHIVKNITKYKSRTIKVAKILDSMRGIVWGDTPGLPYYENAAISKRMEDGRPVKWHIINTIIAHSPEELTSPDRLIKCIKTHLALLV